MFGVCGAAPAGFGSVPSPGFLGDFPGGGFSLLADVTLSPTQLVIAAVMFVVTLIGYHFKIGDYIREQAGTPEKKQSVSIDGQPIEFKGTARVVNHEDLDTRLSGYATTGDLHEAESRIEGKMEQNFRALDQKRSTSIANVHEHLRGISEKLVAKMDEDSQTRREETSDLHEKVNTIAVSVAEMRGEMRKKGHS